MNREPKHTLRPERSKAEWLELIDRYFGAETSEMEENELKRFLVSAQGQDACYDEVRATLSFLQVGKSLHRKPMREPRRFGLPTWAKGAAVAACALIAFVAAWQLDTAENRCVAYVYGKKVTDEQQVMDEVKQTLTMILNNEDRPDVENQLDQMFNPN